MRDCGDLQFLIEQPDLTIEGLTLSLTDAFRVTIDVTGHIEEIEIEQGDEWHAIGHRHPLHDVMRSHVYVTCKTDIEECIGEHRADAINRRADWAYEQRY